MGWLLPTQASPLADRALTVTTEHGGWVPAHFAIEIARVLRTRERRNLLTQQNSDFALRSLRALLLRQDPEPALDVIKTVVDLARRQSLRIADAAFLELAMRMNLPLATQDIALARAATRTGISLFSA
jgi:predicted nucleic acid-binding protein